MKYIHNNQPLPEGKSFTIGDERFGSNWLVNATPEQLAERGITIYSIPASTPPPKVNHKFNFVTQDGDNWVVTPRPLDTLKRGMIADAKSTAASLLSNSDWMVVKQTETGVGVLPQWTDWRTAVREESNRIEAEVEAATDTAGLEAIKPDWPLDPDFIAKEARVAAEAAANKLKKENLND